MARRPSPTTNMPADPLDLDTMEFNLDAMRIAKHYTRHLLGLAVAHAEGTEVLDFGAGIGTYSKELAARGFGVTCCEIDESRRKHLRSLGLKAEESLSSISDESVTYVISFNVLEHIENDEQILNCLHSKLKPGGKILLYVPAFPALWTWMDTRVGHCRRYKRRELCRKLERSGFDVERSYYVDCLGFFVTLLFKCFGNRSGNLNLPLLKIYDRIVFPISTALDCFFKPFFGKNLLIVGHRKYR